MNRRTAIVAPENLLERPVRRGSAASLRYRPSRIADIRVERKTACRSITQLPNYSIDNLVDPVVAIFLAIILLVTRVIGRKKVALFVHVARCVTTLLTHVDLELLCRTASLPAIKKVPASVKSLRHLNSHPPP